jgi:branched-chain amino acid transport system substrate-binding protein
MLCQTGNCADWGSAALKGAQLAKEQLNAVGGVLSKRIDFVVEDSAESISGARAVSAFQSLLAKNLRSYIGPSWSPAALAIAPIVAPRTNILLITPSASAREFSRSALHLFNIRPPEELTTRSLARYPFNQGKKRAAIFSSQQAAESTQGRIFEDEFKKLGGEITIRIEAMPTQNELKGEALKIIQTEPDAIFLMNYNQMEVGIKDLNTLGFKGMRLAISLDDARVAKIRQSGAAVTSETLMKQLPNFSFSGVLGTTVFSSHNSLERREKILQVKEGHLVEVAG